MDEIEQLLAMIEQYIQENGDNIDPSLMNEFASFAQEISSLTQELAGLQPQGEPPPGEPPVATSPFAVPQSEELLWVLSGGNPGVFVQYVSTFPDDDLRPLLRNPAQLQARIQELQSQNLISERGQVDGIPQADLQSSNIYGAKYDPKTQKLKVRFQGDGVYEFSGVPEFIYNVFASGAIPAKTTGKNRFGFWFKNKNPSLGAAFHELIKLGGYPYQKIS